jgi:thioredoxin 1
MAMRLRFVQLLYTKEKIMDIPKTGKVLLDFFATWCRPCQAMKTAVDGITTVPVVKIDIEEEPELATQYSVRSVPTFVVLNDGVEVTRKLGVMPPSQLEALVNS